MAKAKKKARKKNLKSIGAEIGGKIGGEIEKELGKKGGEKAVCKTKPGGDCGAIYGLGLIGALVYFIQYADGFWLGVLGILKALLWPAFLVYELLLMTGI